MQNKSFIIWMQLIYVLSLRIEITNKSIMNTQLTTTDYTALANCILANCPDESKTFELEYETAGYVMFLEVSYDFDTREVIGGSFEGWDFERLSEVSYERLDVVSAEAYDNEGDTINIEISTSIIEKLLN